METYNLPNNRKLKVEQSQFHESPREWDNITTLIFFGAYSHIGDKHEFNTNDHEGWDEMEEAIKKHYGKQLVHIEKIYAYSHSGLTISRTPFSCPWDSGTLGFAIITRKNINKCFGNATKKNIEMAISQVEGEIETLDQYVRGDVYSFEIVKVEKCDKGYEHEDYEDSCSGFYGSDIQSNGILDHLSEEDRVFIIKNL